MNKNLYEKYMIKLLNETDLIHPPLLFQRFFGRSFEQYIYHALDKAWIFRSKKRDHYPECFYIEIDIIRGGRHVR